MAKTHDTQSKIQAVLNSSVTDEVLLEKLWSNPHGAMLEQGIEIPSEVEIRTVSRSSETFHLVLPPDPNESISDEGLNSVSGGLCVFTVSTDFTIGDEYYPGIKKPD